MQSRLLLTPALQVIIAYTIYAFNEAPVEASNPKPTEEKKGE